MNEYELRWIIKDKSGQKETAEACRREGIAFLPFAMETLGGLLFGRLSLTLMRANAVMISTRCQDADLPQALVDGIQ